jgi:phosphoglycolate phosphatase-like HAD superfamily hydrolase
MKATIFDCDGTLVAGEVLANRVLVGQVRQGPPTPSKAVQAVDESTANIYHGVEALGSSGKLEPLTGPNASQEATATRVPGYA